MHKSKLSILVDAAHVQIALRHQLGKLDIEFADDHSEVAMLAMAFWHIVSSQLVSIVNENEEKFDAYEDSGRLSVYIFDAIYDESLIEEITSSAVFLKKNYEQKIRKRAAQIKAIYEWSLAFPGDPQFDSEEFIAYTVKPHQRDSDGRPIYLDDQQHEVTSKVVHASSNNFNFRDVPTVPGIYLGFVGNDRRADEGISQKTVDTMLAMAGTLKVQEGRDVVLIGSDSDFLPLANYALQCGRSFRLLSLTEAHPKWELFDSNKRFTRSVSRVELHPEWLDEGA